MNQVTTFALAMSCTIPALIGIIRYTKINTAFHPFIWIVIYDFITELTAGLPIILSKNESLMYVAYTFYPFISSFLYLVFFYRIQLIKNKLLVWALPLTALLVYTVVSLVVYDKFFGSSFIIWFDAGFGMFNIIMAILLLGSQVIYTKTPALKNPKTLIAVGYILMNSFFVFTKLLITMDLLKGSDINYSIYSIFKVLNSSSYLIYAWAILWIPRKTTY